MGASYQYDESGQFGFFVITFLLLILLPWTYATLKSKRSPAARIPPPCKGWNGKDESITKTRSRAAGISKRHIALAAGWAALGYQTYRVSQIENTAQVYDPFAILGITYGMAEKDIKRHYRKLSLKFHPDKVQLADNQTKEEADDKFVALTKAYKALTDDTIRRNFELYGHPDGKQETSMGIALPKWIVESQNNVYVLGVYGLLFGILLPYFVGRWWYGSRRFTKDLILNDSAAVHFREVEEESTFPHLVEIVSASAEFADLKGSKALDQLEPKVLEALKGVGENLDGRLYKKTSARRAGILIYAHLLRIPIDNMALLKQKNDVIAKAHHLTTGIANVAIAYTWLPPFLATLTLRQCLLQGTHPSFSPLLQLPYMKPSMVADLKAKEDLTSIAEFARTDLKTLKAVLPDLNDTQLQRASDVAKHWPEVELVSATFKVVGEKVITPASIVNVVLELKLAPPGSTKPASNGTASSALAATGAGEVEVEGVEEGKETKLDELIGRKKEGSDGEVPVGYAHLPRFPGDRKSAYTAFVGDHKPNRIHVLPSRFTDLGEGSVRKISLMFQAPGQPGLYLWTCFVKSDCYVGTDLAIPMKLKVEPPSEVADDEDDISEPDEDTLAGQMAAMRGQPTKKAGEGGDDDEDSDDTSGTDDDEEEEEDSSDSDDD